MDAWTSPNHRAFVAWTVHLQHEGHILAFLLDIIEVPEVRLSDTSLFLTDSFLQSHTGDTLGQEFHNMLVEHGLEDKVNLSPFILLLFDSLETDFLIHR